MLVMLTEEVAGELPQYRGPPLFANVGSLVQLGQEIFVKHDLYGLHVESLCGFGLLSKQRVRQEGLDSRLHGLADREVCSRPRRKPASSMASSTRGHRSWKTKPTVRPGAGSRKGT